MKAELIDEIAELRENVDMYLYHVGALVNENEKIGVEVIGQLVSFSDHFKELAKEIDAYRRT